MIEGTVVEINAIEIGWLVTVKSAGHCFSGVWQQLDCPSMHARVSVELDIGLMLDDIDILETLDRTYDSTVSGKENVLHGMVDGVDEDLLHYFRLSESCLIMIEARQRRLETGSFYRLSLPATALEITAAGFGGRR